MKVVLALLVGYLLGSVLPAVNLSLSRGGDIRFRGDRNPGATNTWAVLGPAAGIATASFDIAKSLIAMLAAWLLGVGDLWMYATGVAAIVGHRFPVWHGFHGGQGMAASVGMLLYFLSVVMLAGRVSLLWIMGFALLVALAFVLSGNPTIIGTVVLPVAALLLVFNAPSFTFGAFALSVTTYMWAVQIWLGLKNNLFHLEAWPREGLQRFAGRLRG